MHTQPAGQENQPKSLQHNTLNKSRHRKETAQSLFMAKLQSLSSKQQILLNFYQVSDEHESERLCRGTSQNLKTNSVRKLQKSI